MLHLSPRARVPQLLIPRRCEFVSLLSSYTVLCLNDITAWPHMRVNGGTWYFNNVARGGRVMWILSSFRSRVMRLLDSYPTLKLTKNTPQGKRMPALPLGPLILNPERAAGVKAADWQLFDQTLINSLLLSAAIGQNLTLDSEGPDSLENLVDMRTGNRYRYSV